MELSILHRDADLVFVDKPTRVVVHATRGGVGRPLLQRVRDQLGQQVFLLHRLDAATSGVIALARSAAAASRYGPKFGERRVLKRYLALVRGVPPEQGVIDNPVPRTEDGPRVPAVSAYRRLWTSGRYSLVVVRPRTGRRHQVRRHLKHESWPIIGDVRYGKGEHNRRFRSEVGLCRLALHACALEFAGRCVQSPLPADLHEPLSRFGVSRSILETAHRVELCSPPEAVQNHCPAGEGGD